jgi:Tfp pilus assembly protein PilF
VAFPEQQPPFALIFGPLFGNGTWFLTFRNKDSTMNRRMTSTPFRSATVWRGNWAGAVLAASIVFAIWPGAGRAQTLTTEVLIGDAVADLGPKYSDVDEAIKRFNNGDAYSARALLEVARKKSPSLPPTDVTLAKMFLLSRNAAAGRATLEKAVAENAADPEAYLIIADMDAAQGGTVEAEALYDKAMSLTEKFEENPKRKRNFGIRARWGRAQIFERRKNWNSMGADLQALLRIDEHNAAARYKMGVALCRLNRFTEGKAAFDAARKEDKKLPNAWLSVALINDQMKKTDDARKAFAEAIKEDQNDLSVMTNYAQWLIKNDNVAEAEKRLELARKTHPDSLDVYTLSGAAAVMSGKMKEAEEFFVIAHGKSPANVAVTNQLALIAIEQPEEESKSRALQFASMNVKMNENNADAQITLAWIYFKLGNSGNANNHFRNGLQLGNLNPDSSYLAAVMLSSQNQSEPTERAKLLLSDALTSEAPGIFLRRKEAQDLLKKLEGR